MQIKCVFTFGMQTKSTVTGRSEHHLDLLHGQPAEGRAAFPLLSMLREGER